MTSPRYASSTPECSMCIKCSDRCRIRNVSTWLTISFGHVTLTVTNKIDRFNSSIFTCTLRGVNTVAIPKCQLLQTSMRTYVQRRARNENHSIVKSWVTSLLKSYSKSVESKLSAVLTIAPTLTH